MGYAGAGRVAAPVALAAGSGATGELVAAGAVATGTGDVVSGVRKASPTRAASTTTKAANAVYASTLLGTVHNPFRSYDLLASAYDQRPHGGAEMPKHRK